MPFFRQRSPLAILLALWLPLAQSASAIDLTPGAQFTTGLESSEERQQGNLHLLVPLAPESTGSTLLFLYPSATADDNGSEQYGLGLGARSLLPSQNAYLGANLFYDHAQSSHNHSFHHLGFGLEYKSRWFDLTANYYLPLSNREFRIDEHQETSIAQTISQGQSTAISYSDPYGQGYQIKQDRITSLVTTTRTSTFTTDQFFERFETSLEGYDVEGGFRLPLFEKIEARVLAGYLHFDNPYGEDIQSGKLRGEIRPVPGVAIDLEYFTDDDYLGSHYNIGVRASVPLGVEGGLRKSFAMAFQPRQRPFAERLTEDIIRERQPVQIRESDFIEDLSRRKTRTEVEEERDVRIVGVETIIVEPRVIFVDQFRAGADQDGSFAKPWDLVQEGADQADGFNQMDNLAWLVHVQGGNVAYTENVTVTGNDTIIHGSGKPLIYNGKTFGKFPAPLLDGGFFAEDIDQLTIRGFEIQNGFGGAHGVEAHNVLSLTVECNVFNSIGQDGVLVRTDAGLGAQTAISQILDNRVNAAQVGFHFLSDDNSLQENNVADNRLIGASIDTGVFLETLSTSAQTTLIQDNILREIGDIGLQLSSDNTSTLTADVFANRFRDNANDSAFVQSLGGSNLIANFSEGNIFNGAGNAGIHLLADGTTDTQLTIANNQFVGALSNHGILLEGNGSSTGAIGVSQNSFTQDGDFGLSGLFADTSAIDLDISLNTFAGTNDFTRAIQVNYSSTNSGLLDIADNTISQSETGIVLEATTTGVQNQASITDNLIDAGTGISVDANTLAELTAEVSANTMTSTTGNAIEFIKSGSATLNALALNNTIEESAQNGIAFTSSNAGGILNAQATGNTVNSAQNSGIFLNSQSNSTLVGTLSDNNVLGTISGFHALAETSSTLLFNTPGSNFFGSNQGVGARLVGESGGLLLGTLDGNALVSNLSHALLLNAKGDNTFVIATLTDNAILSLNRAAVNINTKETIIIPEPDNNTAPTILATLTDNTIAGTSGIVSTSYSDSTISLLSVADNTFATTQGSFIELNSEHDSTLNANISSPNISVENSAEHVLLLSSFDDSTMNVNFSNAIARNSTQSHIHAEASNFSTLNLNVDNVLFQTFNDNFSSLFNIEVSGFNLSTTNFAITNSTINNTVVNRSGINVRAEDSSTMDVLIDNNQIFGISEGTGGADFIQLRTSSVNPDVAQINATITNNTLQDTNLDAGLQQVNTGIFARAFGGGQINLTIQGNLVDNIADPVRLSAAVDSQIDADILDNFFTNVRGFGTVLNGASGSSVTALIDHNTYTVEVAQQAIAAFAFFANEQNGFTDVDVTNNTIGLGFIDWVHLRTLNGPDAQIIAEFESNTFGSTFGGSGFVIENTATVNTPLIVLRLDDNHFDGTVGGDLFYLANDPNTTSVINIINNVRNEMNNINFIFGNVVEVEDNSNNDAMSIMGVLLLKDLATNTDYDLPANVDFP